jgi:hypothetical protein
LGKTSKGKQAETSNAGRTINALLIVGAVIIAAGIIWYAVKEPSQTVQREVLAKPNITTLDPAQFSGKTRIAYQAAKEVPEVLALLPCYCGCMTGSGHRSNLDCFHDAHGVECAMCQDIAIDARAWYKDGLEIARIREKVKAKYNRSAALTE